MISTIHDLTAVKKQEKHKKNEIDKDVNHLELLEVIDEYDCK